MTECCCANTKVVSVDDYNAVLEAAHNYVEGLRTGDADTVAKAFHKEAIMYGLAGGKTLLGGPIGNLYDFVRRNGSAPEIKTHMDVLAITPTTAVVRIDMEKMPSVPTTTTTSRSSSLMAVGRQSRRFSISSIADDLQFSKGASQ